MIDSLAAFSESAICNLEPPDSLTNRWQYCIGLKNASP